MHDVRETFFDSEKLPARMLRDPKDNTLSNYQEIPVLAFSQVNISPDAATDNQNKQENYSVVKC